MTMRRDHNEARGLREKLRITAGGFWSGPALSPWVRERGVDQIPCSIEWPFPPTRPATEWLHRIAFKAEYRAKTAGGIGRRRLKL